MSFQANEINSPIKMTCALADLLKRVKLVDWFHLDDKI